MDLGTPCRVLLIGSGGREHAIAAALKRSRYELELITISTRVNPAIKQLSTHYLLVDDLCQFGAIKEVISPFNIDFAVIGPDDPIAVGLTDDLLSLGIKSVAPLKKPAQLESSKGFTRQLLQDYQIDGNIRFEAFKNKQGVAEFLKELGENYVVKADGLAGGKGVKVAGDHLYSHQEAITFIDECFRAGHNSVVIEEKLVGVEFSLMAFSDGKTLKFMPCIQDHKRAFENDEGPNTGGMGTFSCANGGLPFLEERDIYQAQQISQQVLSAVYKKTSEPFVGVLYGGFMACKDGVRLIEYNARFGDPEGLNALSLLKTDFVDLCLAIIETRLNQIDVEFEQQASVLIYAVPEGYPINSQKNKAIQLGELISGVECYYASVDEREGVVYTTGSRTLALVAKAPDVEQARLKALDAITTLTGPVYYRKDIASPQAISSKVRLMNKLRQG